MVDFIMWRWCKVETTHPNLEVSHSDTMFDDKKVGSNPTLRKSFDL